LEFLSWFQPEDSELPGRVMVTAAEVGREVKAVRAVREMMDFMGMCFEIT
jgi:hypothetical protein